MNKTTLFRRLAFIAIISLINVPLAAQSVSTVSNDRQGHSPFSFNVTPPPFSSLWFPGNVAPVASVNNVVHALAESNGELYVGGELTVAGSLPAGYVTRWDGTSWHALGNPQQGVDGPVDALLADGDKVYVGGTFTQAGSLSTRNIAVWDRTTNRWSGLAGGVGGTLRNGVHAIATHNGQLYVGGSFIAAGTTVATFIARWDGRRWHRVGTGVNDVVNTFHIVDDYLYVGGDFTIAGDVPAAGIARYNLVTNTWESAGVNITGSVNAIAHDDRYLYVGGVFDVVEGRIANNIIRIDRQTGEWSPMLNGVIGYDHIYAGINLVKAVEQILVQGDHVYVGGTLTQTFVRTDDGNVPVGLVGFARWDGENWSNLAHADSGTPWPVFVPPGARKATIGPPNIHALLARDNGTIMIGGEFEYVANNSGYLSAPFICTFSVADSTYSPFEGGTIRKGGEISAMASVEGREMGKSLRAFVTTHTRYDLLRAASGSDVGSQASLPHLPAAAIGSVPDDRYWEPVESYSSNDNQVLALAADDEEVYAGGTFTRMFGVEANGIAVYKNRAWEPLEDGPVAGVDGFVYAVAIDGSKVYVGGQFSKAGRVDADNIAVWDRTTKTWSPLGDGITTNGTDPAFISEILIQDGKVYVGGNFTAAGEMPANNIAAWNGTEWSALGNGIDGAVSALEFFKGNLYAGGSFSLAGDISSNGIAYWDGLKWNGMDGGVNGYVNDIITYVTNLDTAIVAGGRFTKEFANIPGVPDGTAWNILWWDGDKWVPKPSLAPSEPPLVSVDGEVRNMLMIGNNLYVGGAFGHAIPKSTGAAAAFLENIAFFNYWNFQNVQIPVWNTLRGGLRGNVNAMAVSGEKVFVAGEFVETTNRELKPDHVAIWDLDEQDWRWAGNPTALEPINALALHKDSLYASGSFTTLEPGLFTVTSHLVRLTRLGWRLAGGPVRGIPYALLPSGDEIIASGSIISADRRISVNVARWNSESDQWNPFTPGSGIASLEDISFASAIATDGDNIYVGGDFDIADTFAVNNVARWNRTTREWTRMGNGLNGPVLALAVDPNGTLYAGGSFNGSGNRTVNHVARWDGTSWQPLGDGINGNVFSLFISDGALYAGGAFNNAGDVTAHNVARWDIASQRWSNLGEGLTADFDPYVSALTVVGGQLFAAGKFDRSGFDSLSNVARWNPAGWWMPLGSGTDRLVNSLVADASTGSLYAGGHFLNAGSQPMKYVGRWTNLVLSVGSESTGSSGAMLGVGTPNPFTTAATVALRLPEGERKPVSVRLFDPTGREIRTLLETSLPSGQFNLSVDGADLTPGVYILRLQYGGEVESAKLIRW